MSLDLAVQNNPYFVVVLGDFNAKSKNWYECHKTNFEGNVLETLFSQFVLHQMISNQTHILDTYSSCVNLIFTFQPNLAVDSGVHPRLHRNCHQQINFAKFNLKVHNPPPYYRQV